MQDTVEPNDFNKGVIDMKMIIGGEKVDASNGEVISVYNPYTHELIDTVPSATEQDIEKALDIAQKGKKIWGETPVYKRAEILFKLADILEANIEKIAGCISKEVGKPLWNGRDEVMAAGRVFRGYSEKMKHLYGEIMPQYPGSEDDMILVTREPLGVVACVVPFNYPFDLLSHKAAPALAAGNALIIKPASDTPMNAVLMTEYMLEAGIPPEVAQIVTGRGSKIGKHLSSSPKINAITVTGSTDVGIDIAKNAAQNLRRVFLEMGGNDAVIIFEDADLDKAVEEVVFGRLHNSGQVCMSSKRLLVQRPIIEEFTRRIIKRVKKVKVGDPFEPDTDMGPLINEKAAITVEKQVQETLSQGAKCVYGGKRYDQTFFEPTVLVDVTPDMDIAKDTEVFGPVITIIGFDTAEEALEIVNQTKYGLSGAVISSDISKAIKVAKKMESGSVVINGHSIYRTSDMPFGGYKMSGLGREGYSVTLKEMTQEKNIILKGILK